LRAEVRGQQEANAERRTSNAEFAAKQKTDKQRIDKEGSQITGGNEVNEDFVSFVRFC